jgi:Protein of unknown function (DUF3486)
MGAKSTIKTLPPEILAAVQRSLKAQHSIDDIVDLLDKMGAPRSRSAVGRYAKNYSAVIAEMQDLRAFTQNMDEELGEDQDPAIRVAVQIASARLVKSMLKKMDSGREPNAMEQNLDAKTIKDLSASKQALQRIALTARKLALEEAAATAQKTLRASGASEETIELIKRELLGLE